MVARQPKGWACMKQWARTETYFSHSTSATKMRCLIPPSLACAWWALMVKLLGKIQCFCTLCAFDHLQCVEIRGRSSLVMVGLAHLWPSIIPTSQHPTCPMWTLALCPSERSSESSESEWRMSIQPVCNPSERDHPYLTPHSTHIVVSQVSRCDSRKWTPCQTGLLWDKRPRCGWCVYRASCCTRAAKRHAQSFLSCPCHWGPSVRVRNGVSCVYLCLKA